jgi:hypothetical protein
MGHPTIPTSFAEFMTMSKEYRAINREDREAFRAVLRGMLDELDKFDQLDEGK